MAMVQLTTNIENTLDIPRVVKWEVFDATDHNRASPPHLTITIRCCGVGAGDSNPYCDKVVNVYDTEASGQLAVNPSPTNYQDSIIVNQVSLSGTPYTTLAAAYWANVTGTGTAAKHIAALQEAIRASAGANGVVSAAFAGT